METIYLIFWLKFKVVLSQPGLFQEPEQALPYCLDIEMKNRQPKPSWAAREVTTATQGPVAQPLPGLLEMGVKSEVGASRRHFTVNSVYPM